MMNAIDLVSAALVTIYFRSEFLGNIVRIEARSFQAGLVKYAQYTKAVHAEFIPKGARKARRIVQTFQPSLLVLEGHNHPAPDAPFRKLSEDATVTVSQSTYSSCDPRWQGDFSAMIDTYIQESGAKVVADYRGHNAY